MGPKSIAKLPTEAERCEAVRQSFFDLTTPPDECSVPKVTKKRGTTTQAATAKVMTVQQAATDSDSDDFVQPKPSGGGGGAAAAAAATAATTTAAKPKATGQKAKAGKTRSTIASSDAADITTSLQQPVSSDHDKLNKLRAELSDISRKEAALRLREKKVRQDMKKFQKRVHKAMAPAQLVAVEDLDEIGDTVGSLFPVRPAAVSSTQDASAVEDAERSDDVAAPTLWKMAQQASDFDEGAGALLDSLKSASSLEGIPPVRAAALRPVALTARGSGSAESAATAPALSLAAVGGAELCAGAKEAPAPQAALEFALGRLLATLGEEEEAADVLDGEEMCSLDSLQEELITLRQTALGDLQAGLYDKLEALIRRYLPIVSSSQMSQAQAQARHARALATLQAVLQELQGNLEAARCAPAAALNQQYVQQAAASCFAARILGHAGIVGDWVFTESAPVAQAVPAPAAGASAMPAAHSAERESSYGASDNDFSEELDCVMHYVPPPADMGGGLAAAAAAAAAGTARPAPSAILLMDLTQSSSNTSQELVGQSPNPVTAAHERMSPQELFAVAQETLPDFAALSTRKLTELGTHFGLKFSVNLPRILSDIWVRMRQQVGQSKSTKSVKGAKGAKGAVAALATSSGGNKRNLESEACRDAEEPVQAKKQKSKISSSNAASQSDAATAASDVHDAAITASLQSELCADVYEKMLMFLPVDLEELHSRLGGAGIKIGKAKLQKFLDRGPVFVSAGAKVSAATGKAHASLNGKKFAHINKMRSPANSQNSATTE